ncbi:MAG: O-antigen ligase family protein [bacterium]|nr:O-antigen ligase family protein [bacterium]
MTKIEKTLLWSIRIGAFLLLFTPLIAPEAISKGFFFPFITVKNFYFRIVAELTIGAWGALAIINPDYRPRKNPILIAFTIFIGVILLASIFGVDPYHSFWSNFERMEGLITHLHLLGLLFVLTSLFKKEYEWFYFFNISLAISFLVASHGLLQYLNITETLGNTRPYALLGNSIYLAVYLMTHLFIAVVMFYRVNASWARILYSFSFLFGLYVLFLAASRGVFIGFGVGMTIIAFGLIFSHMAWKYRMLGALTIGFLLIIGSLVAFFPETAIVKNVDLLGRLSAISFAQLGDDSRVKIWGIALEAFKERPFLGWGPENFIVPFGELYNPTLFGNEPWFDRAHNMLLEWLVGAGIMGFVSYLGIFGASVYVLHVLYKRGTFSRMMTTMMIGFFVAYIIQNAFVFDNIVTYIFLVSVLAYLGSRYEPEGQPSKILKSSFHFRSVGAATVLALTVVSLFVLNVRPILASRQIITALESLGTSETPEQAVAEFLKVEDYKTFGTTEARERLADTVVQISFQLDNVGPGAVVLLDAAIDGLEREVEFQPRVAKYPLFLGKLYILKQHWTGEGAEDSRMWYARARELSPNYVQILLGQTELELILGNNEEAIRIVDEAYLLAPRSASMFYAALSTHLLANNIKGADAILEEYVTGLKPGQGFEIEKVEEVFRRSLRVGDLSARAEFLERLEAYSGSTVITHSVFVQTYADMGDIKRAKEHAKALVELDPTQRSSVAPLLDGE